MLTSDIRPLTSKADFPERELESVEEVAVVTDCIKVSVDEFE